MRYFTRAHYIKAPDTTGTDGRKPSSYFVSNSKALTDNHSYTSSIFVCDLTCVLSSFQCLFLYKCRFHSSSINYLFCLLLLRLLSLYYIVHP
ncbi:hypothetical protein O181_055474 [Austropuccinia psidii MF-1]|uniref:Uncharacterized protein n=1 Tax=Austropuccinia psidii MF-1 TaxID=1389203 RepID=A0A9Q3E6J8_9BASI|nr:hypothetical protein [Austropuccinia psidii MF-1]